MKLSKILALFFACALVTSCGQQNGGKRGSSSEPEIYEGTDPSTILNGYYKAEFIAFKYLLLAVRFFQVEIAILHNDRDKILYLKSKPVDVSFMLVNDVRQPKSFMFHGVGYFTPYDVNISDVITV